MKLSWKQKKQYSKPKSAFVNAGRSWGKKRKITLPYLKCLQVAPLTEADDVNVKFPRELKANRRIK